MVCKLWRVFVGDLAKGAQGHLKANKVKKNNKAKQKKSHAHINNTDSIVWKRGSNLVSCRIPIQSKYSTSPNICFDQFSILDKNPPPKSHWMKMDSTPQKEIYLGIPNMHTPVKRATCKKSTVWTKWNSIDGLSRLFKKALYKYYLK